MRSTSRPEPVRGRLDPELRAIVRVKRQLIHPAGADTELDLPGHARALSGLARFDGRIIGIQDDTNSLLLLNEIGDLRGHVVLPAGTDGKRQFDGVRGNKHLKHDFEAGITTRDARGDSLLAFGSGSTSHRERILRAHMGGLFDAGIIHTPDFYAALRALHDFSGSELNIEAVVQIGSIIRLFNRGNGAATNWLQPVNATVDVSSDDLVRYLDAPSPSTTPPLSNVVVYELGHLDGCALSFTDAAELEGSMIFSAAAERSPDAIRDGVVIGSVLGVIANGEARWTPLTDADGAAIVSKVEAVLPGATWQDPLMLATDPDDPDAPSQIYDVELRGPWRA
jgi:hypothetical protein